MFKKLFSLFITFFKIGLFTFGGGYAMLSLIEAETVTKKQWLSGNELLNIVSIAESTPGPISINSATYIGYKRAGFLGALFATLGVVLPSFVIIFIISFFIDRVLEIELIFNAFKGIQAAVAILIIRAGIKMSKDAKKDVFSIVLFLLSIAFTVALNFLPFRVSGIYLIIAGGVAGFVYYGLIKKRKGDLSVAKVDISDGTAPVNQDTVKSDDLSTSVNNTDEQPVTESNADEQPVTESNADEQPAAANNGDEQTATGNNGEDTPAKHTDEQPAAANNGDEQTAAENNTDETKNSQGEENGGDKI